MDHFDAFIIMSGGLARKPEGGWRTTRFDDPGDEGGLLGDRLRIDAAEVLHREYPDAMIVMSGGRGHMNPEPDQPEVATVMKQELIELGVPEACIITDLTTNSTIDQLRSLDRLHDEYGWHHFGLVSNEYHLPRVLEMAETLDVIQSSHIECHLIAAEAVLRSDNEEKWGALIDNAYASEAMAHRKMREQEGIDALRNGTYKL